MPVHIWGGRVIVEQAATVEIGAIVVGSASAPALWWERDR
jgi:hypothetical protein